MTSRVVKRGSDVEEKVDLALGSAGRVRRCMLSSVEAVRKVCQLPIAFRSKAYAQWACTHCALCVRLSKPARARSV